MNTIQLKESYNPCRDIIEGRLKLPTIQTVPLQTFVVPPKPVDENFLPPLVAAATDSDITMPGGRLRIDPLIEDFVRTQVEEFTAGELGEYLVARGAELNNPRATALKKIHELIGQDRVVFHRRVSMKHFYKIVRA